MCGIVGYIGNKPAKPILLKGLSNLEYRGYDSAGFAVLHEDKINVLKDVGRVEHLINISNASNFNSSIGIAHTRWATHGKPSKENSHPHLDNSATFAVVHNGIIENYSVLKTFLESNGYIFHSQTDTEIIPNLIHYFYKQNNDFLKSVSLACQKLEGSYAISVICKFNPDKIIVAKKDSPLVIGKGENEYFISSDIPAILSYTKEFYFINDLEFAQIYKTEIQFYDSSLNSIKKAPQVLDLGSNSAQKNGYADFMLKEINEQPGAILNTLQDIDFDYAMINNFNKIYIIACGTAMHAGLIRKSLNRRALQNSCNYRYCF